MKNNTILVIDRDCICFAILQLNFSKLGLHPLWVHITNFADTIEYLKQYKTPGLVFLDPVLPDMQPEQALLILNKLQIFSNTNVCLLTTYRQPELNNLGNEYLIFKRVTKPFLSSHLQELVQQNIFA